MDKEFRGHSYRSHVSYIESHQSLLHMYGLKRVPSKSCLHHAAVVLARCAKIQEAVGNACRGRGARIPVACQVRDHAFLGRRSRLVDVVEWGEEGFGSGSNPFAFSPPFSFIPAIVSLGPNPLRVLAAPLILAAVLAVFLVHWG